MALLVLDTHIVLDLWFFEEPTARPLRAALLDGSVRWIATAPMREELTRVLTYTHVVRWAASRQQAPSLALQAFDTHASVLPEAPPLANALNLTCRDPDDQKFIDLAVAHGALLLSKDTQVLALRKRLRACGVEVRSAWVS